MSSIWVSGQYKSFIRPAIEYSCLLFAHAEENLLRKIQSIETEAKKIAYDLAPWTSNYWCYTKIEFTPTYSTVHESSRQIFLKQKFQWSTYQKDYWNLKTKYDWQT